jgi:hypothetical protein
MSELLLLPVVRGVASKAASALIQTVTHMCGVDGDRCKLERQLLAVQCKLTDAEVKSETNQYVKRWMMDFRTVAYEADDVLDDFQYEALRSQTKIGVSKTRKVLIHFTSDSPLLFRLTMSRKLRNVLEKINELVEEMNTFGLLNSVEQPQVPCRQTHAALSEYAEIFGRDADRELVVKLLLDQQDNQKVQVLPIFGMGGLGKTTLAKMVYNDHRVQQHFQLNMWHCVSENFEACSLVKSVIELATKGACNLPETIELLRVRLQEVIGKKRYLLVLDDVWNEEDRKWEDELKPLLCSVGGMGSVIVVTCRSKRVASIMGTLGPHKLSCLSDDDSWELFSKKAFSNCVEEQTELVTIGRCIAQKCMGLPLALKIMGGLMSSKQQLHEWEAIEESNIGDSVQGKDEIMSILKVSYKHLSSEMKQCFALCALFPKGYEMEKDLLIQLWMANGFIQDDDTTKLTQKGESIFCDLVCRSFFQELKIKKWYCIGNDTSYEAIGCKMHDLMHDLAKHVTDECATVEELIQQKGSVKHVRHMTTLKYDEEEQNNGVLKDTVYLRTFLEPLILPKNLKELRLTSLRVLRCYNPSIIHNRVINGKHLRYLDLSRSGIVRLPDSICALYNLQCLRLNDCSILQHLPEDMSTMRKLVHLYLFGCGSLERMPPNIKLLSNLRTLTNFVVDTEVGRGIDELEDLHRLGKRLELYNLRKINSENDAKKANLHQKLNIVELLMHWGRRKYDMPEDEACNEEQVLESLTPHSKLQILAVHGYGGLEISHWMREPGMFQCLRKLKMSNCPRCKNIPLVWLSTSLENLFLYDMGSLTTLCNSLHMEGEGYSTPVQIFPMLKEMTLHKLPNLEVWVETSLTDPNRLVLFLVLELLKMKDCPKLVSIPDSPVLKDLNITNCCSLPVSSLAHLTALCDLQCDGEGTMSTNMPLGFWPCLVSLTVWSLANMMMLPPEDQKTRKNAETLRVLKLCGPNCFITTVGLSKSQLRLWKCFASVEELWLQQCSNLVRWPMEEFQSLVRLSFLHISLCTNLEGRGSSSEETLPLPHLEKLHICRCRSLPELPKLPASLEELKISQCKNLVALPSNLGDLTKLTVLYVDRCYDLKALPDGMNHLASLEQLQIQGPGGEKFQLGPVQWPPAIRSLMITGCPELQRRCRGGVFPLGLLYCDQMHSSTRVPARRNRIEYEKVSEEAPPSVC